MKNLWKLILVVVLAFIGFFEKQEANETETVSTFTLVDVVNLATSEKEVDTGITLDSNASESDA